VFQFTFFRVLEVAMESFDWSAEVEIEEFLI